jgi:hypothetical protein
MERIRANERHAMMVLRHDVEHRCIVELLKILEDAQCPDYMLHKVLMWAYNAKSIGFDFTQKRCPGKQTSDGCIGLCNIRSTISPR